MVRFMQAIKPILPMDKSISQEIIQLAPHWKDISILELENKQSVLILICTDQEYSLRVHKLLKNDFNLIVKTNITDEFNLGIEFINAEYTLVLNTQRTKQTYAPLELLQLNKVNYITTGVRVDGGKLLYNHDYYPLIRPYLN